MKHILALVLLLAGISSVQAMQGETNGKKQHRGSLTDLTDLESGKHVNRPMACHRRSRSNGASVANLAALDAQSKRSAAQRFVAVHKPAEADPEPGCCSLLFALMILSMVP